MEPLVSVVVTTYNSAKFVVETLESVKTQSYKNIELLVSDDCSKDDTVKVATEWLNKNAGRFVRTDVITVAINTGVSANCNRSIAAANADWIKFIAGDDILFPNCIEDNMKFASDHPDAKILFSHVKVYRNTFASENYLRTIPGKFPDNLMKESFTAKTQFERLLISDRISYTPSYFFKKEAILNVGGYDEQWKFAEDYPMWLKLTAAGVRLFFFDSVTVGYRQHDAALNNISSEKIVKPLQLKTFGFRKSYVHQYLPWDIVMAERFSHLISVGFERAGLNKARPSNRMLYRFMTVYLNPFMYLISIKKHLVYRNRNHAFYSN